MIYYNEGKNVVKIWSKEVEKSAMEQIKNVSNLPFIYKHIAIMADNHAGYGCPIGTVVATKDVVIPNLTGVDIGCGMCAVKTSLTEIDTDTLKKIMGEIRKVIPVGFNKHQKKQDKKLMPFINAPNNYYHRDAIYFGNNKLHINDMPLSEIYYPIITKEYDNALKSLGTCGGGNHFIEIQKGDDGHIWIMIHSGSRNLGLKVAQHYNELAIKLNTKWHSSVPKEWELAFLPVDSEEGQAYIREMNYCVEFALANRKLMMERVKNIFSQEMVKNSNSFRFRKDFTSNFEQEINIAHNYASQENHFGQNVWVHRKGATQAKKGQIGIIPGSLGSPSYIIEGLGNKDSFCSSPHGAGRKLGRKNAIRTLSFKKEIEILNRQNIIHGLRSQNDLEEATSCYKDINKVMKNSKDLVKILVKLQPLASIKG